MSEYQYYEFLALDRPLTDKQRAELRSISTRAEITATRFVNEYQWGDLKGDPRKMMERYFDAFLYLANWGTRRLMFRLPRGALSSKTAERYCYTDTASLIETGSHLILSLYVDREPDDSWDEPGGQLAAMVQARAELSAGDLRLLYLAWLFTSSRQPDRSRDDCVESLGSERGIVTKVEVDVALERAIGAESGPAAAARIVTLVGALPRELDARPAGSWRTSGKPPGRRLNSYGLSRLRSGGYLRPDG